MKPFLIFDFDGTLHETLDIYRYGVEKACNWLRNEQNIDAELPADERVSSWLGLSTPDMWEDFMPDLDTKLQEEGGRLVGQGMLEAIDDGKAHFFDGVKDMLDQLKDAGYMMVILSNSDSIYAEKQWDNFDLGRWFTMFYDCESYDFIPKAEIAKEVASDAEALLFDESEKPDMKFVVIGDRESDKEAARSIGARFIACDYGYGREGELDGADGIAENPSQIADLISQWG